MDDSLHVALPEVSYSTREIRLAYALAGERGTADWTKAVLLVSSPRTPLQVLLNRLRIWFVWVALAAGTGSLLLAFWLSNRISRPLMDLAHKTEEVDLDGWRVGFDDYRQDEVGILARFLDRMTRRLQASVNQLREAERNATLGEIARQVNHDIKNGLVPMRNVFRHLMQEADSDSTRVGEVLLARKQVIEDSIVYLEGLARNYARISNRPANELCDLEAIVRQVVTAMSGYPGVEVGFKALTDSAPVLADPISLRRVVENIVRNACESMHDTGGRVDIVLSAEPDEDDNPGVGLVICDTGPGIVPEQLTKVFDDFFTTKRRGAGLGLSIVRRLVSDFGGTIEVVNRPARGAKFSVWLPSARFD